ncbi:MAG: glycosyltransferase family 4 protein [Alphaproteobacteria bacterium]|nr:glycosyltransferase family 4 protein [Alphaproteobacteria bacterium]
MAEISFVLPVRGGGGGAHSVVQEVGAMRALGVEAGILVNEKNYGAFRRTYARFDWLDKACQVFTGPKDLGERIAGCETVVATTNTSVHSLAEALPGAKFAGRTAYYVQDYEPLFYEVGSEAWNVALASFGVLSACTYFAKTSWLRDIVGAIHGLPVKQVVPSIDGTLYRPGGTRGTRRTVCGMVRPSTPRRAPRRTARVLTRLAEKHGADLKVVAFGADADELKGSGIDVGDSVVLAGELPQAGVADLLRQTDFFLDLSDYQAFGRTAAEAMACGAVALAPLVGGASDFIEHGTNSFLADTTNEGAVLDATEAALDLSEIELRAMRFAGLEAVAGYTPARAAISELRALGY